MKKYIYTGIVFVVLLCIIVGQQKWIGKVTADRDVYRNNNATLLTDIKRYKTSDSLNAVSVGNLTFTVKEFRKYRANDYELIKTLRADKKRLQTVTTAQTQTIYQLKGELKDSTTASIDSSGVVRIDTLKCVEIQDKWFDLTGCIDTNAQFVGRFENRDSLLYVEHIVPKRFLFIKWGCKERRQEIVSRNPHTRIVGAEFIRLRK